MVSQQKKLCPEGKVVLCDKRPSQPHEERKGLTEDLLICRLPNKLQRRDRLIAHADIVGAIDARGLPIAKRSLDRVRRIEDLTHVGGVDERLGGVGHEVVRGFGVAVDVAEAEMD